MCDVSALEAVPFYTLHNPHTLETRGYIPDIPCRPHPFYHNQFHLLYPGMCPGCPLMTTGRNCYSRRLEHEKHEDDNAIQARTKKQAGGNT